MEERKILLFRKRKACAKMSQQKCFGIDISSLLENWRLGQVSEKEGFAKGGILAHFKL
jgi:hypothetical protein